MFVYLFVESSEIKMVFQTYQVDIGPEVDDNTTNTISRTNNLVEGSDYSNNVTTHPRFVIGGIELYVGKEIDVMDTHERWSEAEVLKIDPHNYTIYITYTYYNHSWDEQLSEDDVQNRVAERNEPDKRYGEWTT